MRIQALVLLSLLSLSNVYSQEAGGSAAPTTLWRFLGIPQGVQKVRDVVTNRRGNRPGMERSDPLKRIADPENLESDNPAIKAAAEIKQAEDMKMQKIKAIKYLATIGCGCYDKDAKVTEALIASTDDCNPEVRQAAIEAIDDASSRECCRKCGSTSCCNEKISKRLSEIAYERDDSGCPLEPNAEIRRLAKQVLRKCCPGGLPLGPIEEETTDAPNEGAVGEDDVQAEPEQLPPVPGESDAEPLQIPGEAGPESSEEAGVLEALSRTEVADSGEDSERNVHPSAQFGRVYRGGDHETSPSDRTRENGVRLQVSDRAAVRGEMSKPARSNPSRESRSIQPVPTKYHSSQSEARKLVPVARRQLTPSVITGPVTQLRLNTNPGTIQPSKRQPVRELKVFALASWEEPNQTTLASPPGEKTGDSRLSDRPAEFENQWARKPPSAAELPPHQRPRVSRR